MPGMSRISSNNTKHGSIGGVKYVRLHQTVVACAGGGFVVLNSGGYRTVTTKTRINQAMNEWNKGITVFQRNYNWFVCANNSRYDFEPVVEFKDGMVLYSGSELDEDQLEIAEYLMQHWDDCVLDRYGRPTCVPVK